MLSKLLLRTGRISKVNIETYMNSGFLPIFICRFMNPLVEQYKDSPIHFKELSPSYELFCDSKYRGLDFSDYVDRYLEEQSSLDIPRLLARIENLVNSSGLSGAILLCYCKDRTKCHRSVLAEMINSSGLLEVEVEELYV